jgi:GTP-binding protein HflX
VRGPGEAQIEIDRREIGRRISFLEKQIEQLRTQRRQARRRRRRSGLLQISLVGYTNAGKSTLLNRIVGSDVYTADQLFATLDPTTRRVELPSGRVALLSDTVGFIQRLPTELVAAFRATLEEVTEADLLLHIVDVTHPDAVLQAETVDRVLGELGVADLPVVVAANKIDAEGPIEEHLRELRVWAPDLVPISALEGSGITELLEAVDREMQSRLQAIEVLVPYDSGDVLNLLHTHGIVDEEQYVEGGTLVRARVPLYMLGSVGQYLTDTGQEGPAG